MPRHGVREGECRYDAHDWRSLLLRAANGRPIQPHEFRSALVGGKLEVAGLEEIAARLIADNRMLRTALKKILEQHPYAFPSSANQLRETLARCCEWARQAIEGEPPPA